MIKQGLITSLLSMSLISNCMEPQTFATCTWTSCPTTITDESVTTLIQSLREKAEPYNTAMADIRKNEPETFSLLMKARAVGKTFLSKEEQKDTVLTKLRACCGQEFNEQEFTIFIKAEHEKIKSQKTEQECKKYEQKMVALNQIRINCRSDLKKVLNTFCNKRPLFQPTTLSTIDPDLATVLTQTRISPTTFTQLTSVSLDDLNEAFNESIELLIQQLNEIAQNKLNEDEDYLILEIINQKRDTLLKNKPSYSLLVEMNKFPNSI